MASCVLRRNRRTSRPSPIPKIDILLFGISLITCLSSATLLSCTLDARGEPATEQASQSISVDTSQSDPYADLVINAPGSGNMQADIPAQDGSTARTTDEPEDDEQPAAAHEVDSDSAQSWQEQPPPQEAYAPPQGETQQRQGYVVHHTAYREEKVYRTVHHQASSAREITIGGRTHVEWTKCPVCSARHASAYNERVLDHVNQAFCQGCQGRHDASYDETVYY